MQIYKVYLIRCSKTNDIMYAGITRQTLATRFQGHIDRKHIKRCDFYIELVTDELELNQAVELEKMLIKQYNLINKGWNKSPGSINGSSNYHTEEQKAKWSLERKGCKVSEEHAAKNRTSRIGMKNSDNHKKVISECKSKPTMCLETGITYPSARKAAKAMNLSEGKVQLVAQGKRKRTGGYHFVYIETVEPNRND